ncbi:MAG: hypothetical protein LBC18_00335 [Opitutaceae bacterium]|jgi:hypothetical protein|nr:hypothetical protein [Opitutaceae bacterium]
MSRKNKYADRVEFAEGIQAMKEGKDIKTNPYPYSAEIAPGKATENIPHLAWAAGHKAAEKQAAEAHTDTPAQWGTVRVPDGVFEGHTLRVVYSEMREAIAGKSPDEINKTIAEALDEPCARLLLEKWEPEAFADGKEPDVADALLSAAIHLMLGEGDIPAAPAAADLKNELPGRKILVRHNFSEAERLKFAEKMTVAQREIDAAEEQKKRAATQFKSRIEGATAERDEAMEAFRTGYEMREVQCKCVADDPEPGLKTFYREDTGEKARTEEMTAEDKQRLLPLPATGEASADDADADADDADAEAADADESDAGDASGVEPIF